MFGRSTSLDVEPLYTFRGHSGQVLCLSMNSVEDEAFSAGTDGVINCWNLPSVNIDPYDSFESTVLRSRLLGHTDAVWGLAQDGFHQQILSCSADGTLKVWSPSTKTEALHTYMSEQGIRIPLYIFIYDSFMPIGSK
ncbi:unnamed protein product, partial [Nesidiocoris tenuis]